MKQRNLFLLFSLMIILTGCSAASHEESNNREPKYELTLESAIDQKDCFVCGNPPGGLLDYYYKFDSVGIIYWPDLTVIDTGVRTYDDDGNETLEGGSGTRISSFGEGNGSLYRVQSVAGAWNLRDKDLSGRCGRIGLRTTGRTTLPELSGQSL